MACPPKEQGARLASMQSGSDACSGEGKIYAAKLASSEHYSCADKQAFITPTTYQNGAGSVRTDPAQIHTAGMFPKLDPFSSRLTISSSLLSGQ